MKLDKNPNAILIVHCRYTNSGGEDTVVNDHFKLLEEEGFDVSLLIFNNSDIMSAGIQSVMKNSITNSQWVRELRQKIAEVNPTIVFFHNTFPFLGKEAYACVDAAGIKIFQFVHNYRLDCIPGTKYLNGNICNICHGRNKVFGIINKCYHDSYLQSTGAAISQMLNGIVRCDKYISRYLVLNDEIAKMLLRNDMDDRKITMIPNFVKSTRLEIDKAEIESRRGYVFVGRLADEKGIMDLVHSWINMKRYEILTIVGEGPQKEKIEKYLSQQKIDNIFLAGKLDALSVKRKMAESRALIFPSKWLEGMPMVIIEALSIGLPIICNVMNSGKEILPEHSQLIYHNDYELSCAIDSIENMPRDEYAIVCRSHIDRHLRFFDGSETKKILISCMNQYYSNIGGQYV